MTPERQKVLAFTKPYMDNVQVYVVLADSAVQKAEELKGKKLSIQESSTAQTLLDRDENLKKSFGEIKAYPDLTACFMDLESGRADAVLADTCLTEQTDFGNTYYGKKHSERKRQHDGKNKYLGRNAKTAEHIRQYTKNVIHKSLFKNFITVQ
jgi:hypothetical protein